MSFLHPDFAWLFLLLILFIGVSSNHPAFQAVRVPSVDLWFFLQMPPENRLKAGRRFHLSLSSLLFLSAVTLLILALMTPVSPVTQTAGTDEVKIGVLCSPSLPEPVSRVIYLLDNVTVLDSEDKQNIPDHTRLISVVASPPSLSSETGNTLHVNLSNKVASLSDTVLFQVLVSDPHREITQLIYTESQIKTEEFPIALANAIRHFSFKGVCTEKKSPRPKKTFSFWLTALAGTLFLSRILCSGFRRQR